eukprot:m.21061 g.21061  ORF g.21061 m.21061 type:complete len:50 (+) comp7017_c0_seq1:2944-3093(+)
MTWLSLNKFIAHTTRKNKTSLENETPLPLRDGSCTGNGVLASYYKLTCN